MQVTTLSIIFLVKCPETALEFVRTFIDLGLETCRFEIIYLTREDIPHEAITGIPEDYRSCYEEPSRNPPMACDCHGFEVVTDRETHRSLQSIPQSIPRGDNVYGYVRASNILLVFGCMSALILQFYY